MDFSPFKAMTRALGNLYDRASTRAARFVKKKSKDWDDEQKLPLPDRPDAAVTSLVDYSSQWDNLRMKWQTSATRRATHELLRRMGYEEDGRVASAFDSYINMAVGFADYDEEGRDSPVLNIVFRSVPAGLRVTPDEVSAFINQTLRESGFVRQVPTILRNMLAFGNDFREPVFNITKDPPRLMELKWLQEWTLWPKRHPTLGHRMRGYVYDDGISNTEYPENMIIHFKRHEDEYGLGRGLMYEERMNWAALAANEDAIRIDRNIRAHPRFLHYIPVEDGTGHEVQAAKVAAYRRAQTMAQLLDSSKDDVTSIRHPGHVASDYYIPQFVVRDPLNKSDVTTYGGQIVPLEFQSSQLAELADIEYALDRILSKTSVPLRFLNMETEKSGALTEDGVDRDDLHWVHHVRSLQRDFKGDERHGCRKLINLLLLYEYGAVSGFEYDIIMAHINTDDERDEAAVRSVEVATWTTFAAIEPGTISKKWVFMEEFGYDEDDWNTFEEWRKEELEQYHEEMEKYAIDPIDPRTGKIAPSANGVTDSTKVKSGSPALSKSQGEDLILRLVQGETHPVTKSVIKKHAGEVVGNIAIRERDSAKGGESGGQTNKREPTSKRRKRYAKSRAKKGRITTPRTYSTGGDAGSSSGGLRVSGGSGLKS